MIKQMMVKFPQWSWYHAQIKEEERPNVENNRKLLERQAVI